jgi:hypothetical protein
LYLRAQRPTGITLQDLRALEGWKEAWKTTTSRQTDAEGGQTLEEFGRLRQNGVEHAGLQVSVNGLAGSRPRVTSSIDDLR